MIDNKLAILRLDKKAHEELMEHRKPKEPQKPAPAKANNAQTVFDLNGRRPVQKLLTAGTPSP